MVYDSNYVRVLYSLRMRFNGCKFDGIQAQNKHVIVHEEGGTSLRKPTDVDES